MGCQVQFRAAKDICDERNFVLVERSEHVNPNLNKNLGFGLTEKKRFSLDVDVGLELGSQRQGSKEICAGTAGRVQ